MWRCARSRCSRSRDSDVLFLQSKPIIVRIPQDPPKSELSGLADVLLGSLGLTGVIVLAAIALGALMAGIMFWVRSRQDS